MTDAKKLHARDRKGMTPMSFVSPNLPKPRTKTEKAVRKLACEKINMETVCSLHIYDIIELMELAYRHGQGKQGKSETKKAG